MKITSFDKDDSRGALILLTMAANADPEIIRAKLNLVINVGLGPRWKVACLFLLDFFALLNFIAIVVV